MREYAVFLPRDGCQKIIRRIHRIITHTHSPYDTVGRRSDQRVLQLQIMAINFRLIDNPEICAIERPVIGRVAAHVVIAELNIAVLVDGMQPGYLLEIRAGFSVPQRVLVLRAKVDVAVSARAGAVPQLNIKAVAAGWPVIDSGVDQPGAAVVINVHLLPAAAIELAVETVVTARSQCHAIIQILPRAAKPGRDIRDTRFSPIDGHLRFGCGGGLTGKNADHTLHRV